MGVIVLYWSMSVFEPINDVINDGLFVVTAVVSGTPAKIRKTQMAIVHATVFFVLVVLPPYILSPLNYKWFFLLNGEMPHGFLSYYVVQCCKSG